MATITTSFGIGFEANNLSEITEIEQIGNTWQFVIKYRNGKSNTITSDTNKGAHDMRDEVLVAWAAWRANVYSDKPSILVLLLGIFCMIVGVIIGLKH